MLPQFFTKRKIIFFILSLFLITSLFTSVAHAFTTPTNTYQFQFEQAVYGSPDEMNLQSYVNETMKAVMSSSTTLITGCITCESGEGEAGAVNAISNLIALVYTTPPASGIHYLASIGERLNIIQPAYAQQGVGWSKMEPFLNLWKAFRNLTYVFFVLILVFMGFAIMFRVKINPQTVISIQSALPRVVIALILITFSYAIVGLLVDFMFVLMNLMSFTILKIYPFDQFLTIQAVTQAISPITDDIGTLKTLLVTGFIPVSLNLLLIMLIPDIAGNLTAGGSSNVVGLGSFLIFIILAIVFLIALIRVLWSLLKAYVMVVINLIFAPFLILVGVLPGSNAIQSWFRNLIANLAVLPAVFVMTLISAQIILYAIYDRIGEALLGLIVNLILKPSGFNALLTLTQIKIILDSLSSRPEVLGQILILSFISIGILLMTPKISDIIKSFLAGKPFEYGTALGEAFGPVTGPVAGVVGYGVGIGKDLGKTYVTQRVFPREEGEKGMPTGKEPPRSSGVLPAGKYTKMERE